MRKREREKQRDRQTEAGRRRGKEYRTPNS